MGYDALTMAAVAASLRQCLMDGRVQRVVRPSERSLGLEVYAGERHQLLISAEPQHPAVALAPEKLRRGTEAPSPLQLLLRKYVRGARLRAVEQPELERVLILRFVGAEGEVALICEIMGRLSNIILTDAEGEIMDAAVRLPPSLNPYRSVLPGEGYVPPPPQDKAHPLEIGADALREALAAQGGRTLARRLVRAAFGISPLLAREIVHRALGEAEREEGVDPGEAERLRAEMRRLLSLPETGAWRPCVAYEGEGAERRPVDYAPYALTHRDDVEAREGINAAIAEVRAGQLARSRSLRGYEQVRQRLHDVIEGALERLRVRLENLREARVPPEALEELRVQGNAVLTRAYEIERGQEELVVARRLVTGEAGERGGQELRVPLDPGLSPSENAQRIFRRYEKKKAAAQKIPPRIRETELAIAHLRQLAADVDLAENRQELDEVEAALREAGYLRDKGRRPSAGRSQPLRLRAEDGALILVGRNSRQNHQVTFREASGDDLWFHVHGLPGSHVVVKADGEVSPATRRRAAQLAAHYSAARGERSVQVDYTPCRHVRHIRGAAPGLVTYRHEETLVVTPRGPEAEE